MFMSVDLPEPDGPMMAANSPASTRMPIDAQRRHLDDAGRVDLAHVDQLDDRWASRVRVSVTVPTAGELAADRGTGHPRHLAAAGQLTATGEVSAAAVPRVAAGDDDVLDDHLLALFEPAGDLDLSARRLAGRDLERLGAALRRAVEPRRVTVDVPSLVSTARTGTCTTSSLTVDEMAPVIDVPMLYDASSVRNIDRDRVLRDSATTHRRPCRRR